MNLRRNLLAGAAVIVPIVVTYLVLKLLFQSLDSVLQPVLARFLERSFPGLGLVALLLLLYVVGIGARNVVGGWMTGLADRVMGRVPLAGTIYGATRRLVEAFGKSGAAAFQRAVVLEYPRPGLRTIGFVTGETTGGEGRRYLNIFVPTPPNPTSGVLVFLPEEEVEDLKVSLEEAVQMVFSGGVVTPDRTLW